jgi:peptidoglycan/LPS O-acetylase OafA/YrhL
MKLDKASEHNNFTLLRLLLALMVVFGHFKLLSGTSYPIFPFNLADLAVDGFFVVSGYLITASYDGRPQLRPFYIRRLFRLYPLYIIVVLVQAVIMLAILHWGAVGSALHYVAVNAVFLNFLQYHIGTLLAGMPNPGINPSLWTLKIEVAFYIVLPFLWMLVRRWGGGFLLAIFVLSVLYDFGLRHVGMVTLAKQLPGQMQFFVLGMAAYAYRGRLRLSAGWASVFFFCLLPIIALLLTSHFAVIYPLTVATAVFLLACRMPAVPIRTDISYGVYLLHGPVIQFSLILGLFNDSAGGLLAILAVVIVLALVAERLIERPGIDFGRTLSSSRTPSAEAFADPTSTPSI